jgi:hypothetical protein
MPPPSSRAPESINDGARNNLKRKQQEARMVQHLKPKPPVRIPCIFVAQGQRSSGSVPGQGSAHLGGEDEKDAAGVVDHDEEELDDGRVDHLKQVLPGKQSKRFSACKIEMGRSGMLRESFCGSGLRIEDHGLFGNLSRGFVVPKLHFKVSV